MRFSLMSASVVADDLVGDAHVVILVVEADRGAEDDALAGVDALRIDDLQGGNLAFELGDAAFNVTLLFTGGIVLRVFGKVALFTGFGDGGHHVRAGDLLEVVEFGLQLFGASGRDGNAGRDHVANSRKRKL